jgi:hypothetical protein
MASAPSEVPPALSPLDAFAMQSRMLAKKFEEENNAGKRLSRLPVGTVASEFAKSRPGYFRSMTTGSPGFTTHLSPMQEEPYQKNTVEVQTVPNAQRPVSHYPQMVLTDSVFGLGKTFSFQSQLPAVEEQRHAEKHDLQNYSFPRSQSPEEFEEPARNAINVSPPLPPVSSLAVPAPLAVSIGPSLIPQS